MDITWVSLVIDNHLIKSRISDGNFSSVYKGVNQDTKENSIFKVAKLEVQQAQNDGKNHVQINERTRDINQTKANMFCSMGITEAFPDTNKLLEIQYKSLASIKHAGLIKPIHFSNKARLNYIQLPYLEGTNLRQKFKNTSQNDLIKLLIQITDILIEIKRENKNFYHGDIKPENIFITQKHSSLTETIEAPILLDPGYFGPIRSTRGEIIDILLTTPIYYPLLEANDLLALGIILWESVLGKNPFAKVAKISKGKYLKKADLKHIGPNLIEFIQDRELVSLYDYSAILELNFPRSLNSNISSYAESIFLKALSLKRTSNNKLELDEGFSDFAELKEALIKLF